MATVGLRSRPRSALMTARDVLDMLEAGDKASRRVLQQRASIGCDMIVNLSLVLNPNLILMGGQIGSRPGLIGTVKKKLEGSEFAVTRIDAGALGDRATLWGGIATALEVLPGLLLPQPLS